MLGHELDHPITIEANPARVTVCGHDIAGTDTVKQHSVVIDTATSFR